VRDFKDKVVVITGGATGIGFAFAKRFGAEGAKIALAEPRENRLQEAVAALGELGVEATYKVTDVTDRAQVEGLADYAWDTYGHVDVIINNAGIVILEAGVLDTDPAEVERIFAVNFYGVWNGSAVFGKRFIEQGTPAAIYNVGSENSLFHGVPHGAAYIATKHGVLALNETLAEDMPDFVEVGLICPGFVRSELGSDLGFEPPPPEAMAAAMDTDHFVDIAFEQIKAGEFYIVSHAYNIVRINQRYQAIEKAYAKYAPRYEGDQVHDIRSLMAMMHEAMDATNQ
jgi:NAD(P)-dependent dehydrogenase (short-subunit alcohol dehydrogenase family)